MYKLTAFQLSLWFEWKLRPHSTAYNLPIMYKINGDLKLSLLRKSLNYLINRHDTLRTYFLEVDDTPYQIISNQFDYQLDFIDCSSLDNKFVDKIIYEKFNIHFDLKKLPLVKTSVIKLDHTLHFLILNFHHIIIDGSSLELLFQELSEIYNSLFQRKKISLSEIKLTINDVLQSEENYFNSLQYQHDIKIWKNRLADSLFYTSISYSNIQKDYSASTLYVKLSREVTAGIKKLAEINNSTVFIILISCFKIFLYRYTGQEDITINYSVNIKKNIPTLSDCNYLGYFVNLVCLRTKFNPDFTIENMINHITKERIKTRDHVRLPIINLVQKLREINANEGHGLCNINFGVTNINLKLSFKGLKIRSIPTQVKHAQNEFSLLYELFDNRILLKFWFAKQCFPEWFMQSFINHFQLFLKQFIVDSHQVISKISLISNEERQRILFDWNNTDSNYPKEKTIVQVVEEQADLTPDNIAISIDQNSLTYQELNEKSNQLAYVLYEQYNKQYGDVKIPKNTLYCMCIDKSFEMIIAMLAILKVGGVYVPLNRDDPENRLRFILKDTRCRWVMTQKIILDKLPFLKSKNRKIIYVDQEYKVDLGAVIKNDKPSEYLLADDIACVIYTSGSTGHPKGVEVRQQGILRLVKNTNYITIDPTYRIGQVSSISFDAATFEIWGALLNGAQLVLISKDKLLDSQALLQVIQSYSINLLLLTTSLFNQLVDTDISVFKNLHFLLIGGEAASLYHAAQFLQQNKKTKLINVYGPTENTTITTYYHISKINLSPFSMPIGKPISNTKVYVLDAYLQPVPIGVIGELYTGGAGIARGYFNRNQLTTERFILNPFATDRDKVSGYDRLYKTGDLVRWLPNGDLEYIGRKDFQVKIRGYRIELEEIEKNLDNYPAIKKSIVIIREHMHSKYLIGYYLADKSIATADLISYLRKELPEYMIPNIFVYLKSFPLTSSGKIDRHALPDPEIKTEEPYVEPRDELEQTIYNIWQRILGVHNFSIYDNFFKLGGTSILAIKLVHHLSRELKQHVNISSIFLYSTVVALANSVIYHGEPIHIEKQLTDHTELSFAQERLWFIEQFEIGTNAYHIPILMKLLPKVNVKAFKKSIVSIVNRHEVLRTIFRRDEVKGVDLQVVLSNPLVVNEQEIKNDDFKKMLKKQINRIFNLTKEYPIRANIYYCGASVYCLLVVHHIAFDGWSLNIFINELLNFYEYYVGGKKMNLYQINIQYKDYSVWQRKYLTEKILKREINYWQKKLSGYPLMSLRADKIRPTALRYEGDDISFEIDEHISEQLRALAKAQAVSLYAVLLSGFFLLLYKYKNELDLMIGTPVANRHNEQIENLIGFFVNTLPIRVKLNLKQTIRDVINTVHATLIEAHEHQDLPFEKLIESLNIDRDLSRHPLVQIFFSVQSVNKSLSQNLFQLVPTSDYYKVAKFDLSVLIDDSDTSLTGIFNFASRLFYRKTINQLKNHYLLLLQEMVENPDRELKKIKGMSRAEYEALVYRGNMITRAFPKHKLIIALFREQVKRKPHKIAICFGQDSLSYQALDKKTNQLARYIRDRYYKQNQTELMPDTLIAICIERSLDMIVSILAILKAGAAYVPIDPDIPTKRLEYIINDADFKIILTQNKLVKKIKPYFNHIIVSLDRINYHHKADTPISVEIKPQHLAYVIYTSGTTGHPKGVMVEHRNLINFLYSMNDVLKVTSGDSVLALTAYTFDISILELCLPLIKGARCVVINKETSTDSAALIKVIDDENISVMQATPATWYLLQDAGWKFPDKVKILSGGEALPADLAKKILLHRKLFWNVYGPTEVTIWASIYPVEKICFDRYVPIGKPLANIQFLVLNDSLQPVPLGAVGELYIGGASVTRGYLNLPHLTAERFINNPFATEKNKFSEFNRLYKTGDLVSWLPDGNLEYIGRNDFQVKIRGYRIELGDIESNLNNHPTIERSVVIVHEQAGTQYLVAYYLGKKQLSNKTIIDYLAKELPEYMIPSSFMYMETFPLTTSGKVDIKALPTPKFEVNVKYMAPRTQLEKKLAKLWQRILQLEKIGINDDFFKIGGNSILAMRVIAEMKKELGIEIKTFNFFLLKTIRLIIEFSENESRYQPIVALNEDGKQKNKLFMIHPAASDSEAYLKLAKKLEDKFLCFGVENYNLHHKNTIGNLNQLAQLYLNYIKASNHTYGTDYFLFGWSLGGNIALEIAYLLEKEGIKNIIVYLLDTVLPDQYIRAETQRAKVKQKTKERYIRVGLEASHIKRIMRTYKDKVSIASSELSGKLIYTQVVLFKATQIDTATTEYSQDLFKYMLSLKDNNLKNYCKRLKIIKLPCSHSDIINFEDQISIKMVTIHGQIIDQLHS